MAYDQDLANRIRELVRADSKVQEKKIFGDLAFLIGGHMAIAASGKGGALVRVEPQASSRLQDSTKAELAMMRVRPMSGWLHEQAALNALSIGRS
ncbi:MAG: TfoX/Sxy family protein [Acidimicrobiales bacterium]